MIKLNKNELMLVCIDAFNARQRFYKGNYTWKSLYYMIKSASNQNFRDKFCVYHENSLLKSEIAKTQRCNEHFGIMRFYDELSKTNKICSIDHIRAISYEEFERNFIIKEIKTDEDIETNIKANTSYWDD